MAPLWDVYKQDIESDIADVKIIAVSQLPAISAAKFLEYFTKTHCMGTFDVAGVAFDDELKKANMPRRMEYIY
jgi:leucyl aminopeptidase